MITLNAIVPNLYIDKNNNLVEIRIPKTFSVSPVLVRDSSAVRRLIVDLVGDVGALSEGQLWVCTFLRFVAIRFYFLSETLI
jgi:hypothetical protein